MNLQSLSAVALLLACVGVSRANAPAAEQAADALKNSPRHGEWVDIALDEKTKLHTWVSYPERADKAPVVLVIHEIFGMTDWVRATSDALAAEGFIAVAPDFLSGMGENGGGTESFKGDEVRGAIQKLTPDMVATRLNAARDFAKTLPSASEKFGVIGFCWGGTQTFSYATKQPDLGAAVVYYGTAPKDEESLKQITAPVLGQYGGDDARVTATVEPTKAAMEKAGKTYEPVIHVKAGHGFLRQQTGRDGANQKAADAAWTRTISFLHEALGK